MRLPILGFVPQEDLESTEDSGGNSFWEVLARHLSAVIFVINESHFDKNGWHVAISQYFKTTLIDAIIRPSAKIRDFGDFGDFGLDAFREEAVNRILLVIERHTPGSAIGFLD